MGKNSLFFFRKVGFIIIPIATSLSSWFNAIVLYIFTQKKNFFSFNKSFLFKFPRILISSISMSLIFYFLIDLFNENLLFSENLKFIYLSICILITLVSYLLISILTKAFKLSDIKLN